MADKKDDNLEPIDVILDPREEVVARVRDATMFVFLAAVLLVAITGITCTPTMKDAVFTMGLASFSGLNATVGPTVSPAFTLKVHVKNPAVVQSWCSNGGEVVVSYSGVALAWDHVPSFCVPRISASEFTVLPWGREVGMSEDLRRRLVSEWRMGAAQISVEMRLFSPDCWTHAEVCGVESLYRFKLTLLTDVGQGQTD